MDNVDPTVVTQAVNDSAVFWDGLLRGVILSIVFGILGIILTVLGFKVFDWISPRIDIQRELAEKHNIAVAIVCAAVILGICYIIGISIR